MRPASQHPFVLRRSGVCMSLVLAMAATACGNDSGGTQPAPPEGPPEFRIAALQPAGGPRWKRDAPTDCVEFGRDPGGTIDVILSEDGVLQNFTLEPLYGCNGALQCGFVLLSIDPGPDAGALYQVGAAATVFSVPFRQLGIPEGPHGLRVELRDEFGEPLTADGGQPYADSIEPKLNFMSKCNALMPGDRDAGDAAAAADGRVPGEAGPGEASVGDASDAIAPTDATAPTDASSATDAALFDGGAPDSSIPDLDGSAPRDASARDATTGG